MKILTDREIKNMAREKYPIENPNCATERFFKERMRNDYIRKLQEQRDKLLKDAN